MALSAEEQAAQDKLVGVIVAIVGNLCISVSFQVHAGGAFCLASLACYAYTFCLFPQPARAGGASAAVRVPQLLCE